MEALNARLVSVEGGLRANTTGLRANTEQLAVLARRLPLQNSEVNMAAGSAPASAPSDLTNPNHGSRNPDGPAPTPGDRRAGGPGSRDLLRRLKRGYLLQFEGAGEDGEDGDSDGPAQRRAASRRGRLLEAVMREARAQWTGKRGGGWREEERLGREREMW